MTESKTYICYWPEKDKLGLWKRNPGFDFLGLDRYEVDTEDGEFWVDGTPEANGWVVICEY